jgi:hypothetical protein
VIIEPTTDLAPFINARVVINGVRAAWIETMRHYGAESAIESLRGGVGGMCVAVRYRSDGGDRVSAIGGFPGQNHTHELNVYLGGGRVTAPATQGGITMSGDETIEVQAFTIERTTIKTTEDEYREAREAEELGDAYDTYLSDMDGQTLIIDPEFGPVNPYGGTEDLMELLKPILAHVPTWKIEQYATARRAEEE